MSIRVVISDDHALVRKGLTQYLAEEDDIEVIAECGDGEEALGAVRQLDPDILVLDLHMPRRNGLSVLRELSEAKSRTAVVLLVGNISEDQLVEAMQLGVNGLVLKEMAPSLLIQCIRKVYGGGRWIEKDSATLALDKVLRREQQISDIERLLTTRELDVLRRAARGLSNREIADEIFVSEGTVKTHLHSVYEKLGVSGRAKLAVKARELGLVK